MSKVLLLGNKNLVDKFFASLFKVEMGTLKEQKNFVMKYQDMKYSFDYLTKEEAHKEITASSSSSNKLNFIERKNYLCILFFIGPNDVKLLSSEEEKKEKKELFDFVHFSSSQFYLQNPSLLFLIVFEPSTEPSTKNADEKEKMNQKVQEKKEMDGVKEVVDFGKIKYQNKNCLSLRKKKLLFTILKKFNDYYHEMQEQQRKQQEKEEAKSKQSLSGSLFESLGFGSPSSTTKMINEKGEQLMNSFFDQFGFYLNEANEYFNQSFLKTKETIERIIKNQQKRIKIHLLFTLPVVEEGSKVGKEFEQQLINCLKEYKLLDKFLIQMNETKLHKEEEEEEEKEIQVYKIRILLTEEQMKQYEEKTKDEKKEFVLFYQTSSSSSSSIPSFSFENQQKQNDFINYLLFRIVKEKTTNLNQLNEFFSSYFLKPLTQNTQNNEFLQESSKFLKNEFDEIKDDFKDVSNFISNETKDVMEKIKQSEIVKETSMNLGWMKNSISSWFYGEEQQQQQQQPAKKKEEQPKREQKKEEEQEKKE